MFCVIDLVILGAPPLYCLRRNTCSTLSRAMNILTQCKIRRPAHNSLAHEKQTKLSPPPDSLQTIHVHQPQPKKLALSDRPFSANSNCYIKVSRRTKENMTCCSNNRRRCGTTFSFTKVVAPSSCLETEQALSAGSRPSSESGPERSSVFGGESVHGFPPKSGLASALWAASAQWAVSWELPLWPPTLPRTLAISPLNLPHKISGHAQLGRVFQRKLRFMP